MVVVVIIIIILKSLKIILKIVIILLPFPDSFFLPLSLSRGTSAGFHSFVALSVVTRTEDLSPLVKDSFQLEFEVNKYLNIYLYL